MGTRGSLGFIYQNKESLVYNHIDSNPKWLGKHVLKAVSKINSVNGWNKLKENVSKIENIKVDQLYYDVIFIDQVCNGFLQHNINNKFIKNSLFCEYAYIINLDTMKLEFYIGYQKVPQIDNKFGIENIDGFYPCRLVFVFNLNESFEVYDIIEKMEDISNTKIEDSSVIKYFRNNKLNTIKKHD